MNYRPRLTDKHLMVMDALHRGPPAGTNVAKLLDEFSGQMTRSTINNALAAFMKAGLISRSRVEPYHYWVASNLDDDQRAWLADASAAFQEMVGEPLRMVAHPDGDIEPERQEKALVTVEPKADPIAPPKRLKRRIPR
jgi:hypothetical protein